MAQYRKPRWRRWHTASHALIPAAQERKDMYVRRSACARIPGTDSARARGGSALQPAAAQGARDSSSTATGNAHPPLPTHSCTVHAHTLHARGNRGTELFRRRRHGASSAVSPAVQQCHPKACVSPHPPTPHSTHAHTPPAIKVRRSASSLKAEDGCRFVPSHRNPTNHPAAWHGSPPDLCVPSPPPLPPAAMPVCTIAAWQA